jgi:hypothetical protein
VKNIKEKSHIFKKISPCAATTSHYQTNPLSIFGPSKLPKKVKFSRNGA